MKRKPNAQTRAMHAKVALPERPRKRPQIPLTPEQERIRQARHDYEDREIERRQREADRIA